MNATTKERFMYILGGFIVGCAAIILVLLVFQPLPEGNRDVVNLSLGAFIGMAVSVVGYFFGSSKGSADKTALLNKQEEKPVQ